MEAALSADIVSSTSLSSEDLSNLRKELMNTISFFEKSLDPSGVNFWGRIVKGDSIECYLRRVNWSLRIALALKLKTKFWVAPLACSEETKKQGLRFAIGAGTFKTVDRGNDIMDGSPIYLSGREMQKGKKPSRRMMFLTEEDSFGAMRIINNLVIWLDDKVNGMTAKQCEAVYYMLLGLKRSELLEKLDVKQSALSQRLTSVDWNKIENTIIDFEHLNFDML